jgi:hypothetical protein
MHCSVLLHVKQQKRQQHANNPTVQLPLPSVSHDVVHTLVQVAGVTDRIKPK